MATRRTTPPRPGDLLAPWFQLAEVAWSAPLVIAHRLGRMATGGFPPNRRDSREYTRMVQEKSDALVESATALALAGPAAAASLLRASVTPVHRRVVANRKRLGRRR